MLHGMAEVFLFELNVGFLAGLAPTREHQAAGLSRPRTGSYCSNSEPSRLIQNKISLSGGRRPTSAIQEKRLYDNNLLKSDIQIPLAIGIHQPQAIITDVL